MHISEEVLERIAYTCKKYYEKGATPQDLISALAAQFFNILLECCDEGEEDEVLTEYLGCLATMKDQLIAEKEKGTLVK